MEDESISSSSSFSTSSSFSSSSSLSYSLLLSDNTTPFPNPSRHCPPPLTNDGIRSMLFAKYRKPQMIATTTRFGFRPIVQILSISYIRVYGYDDDDIGKKNIKIFRKPKLVLSDSVCSIEAIVEGYQFRTNPPRGTKSSRLKTTRTTETTLKPSIHDLQPNMFIRINDYEVVVCKCQTQFTLKISSFDIINVPRTPTPLGTPKDLNQFHSNDLSILYFTEVNKNSEELGNLKSLRLGFDGARVVATAVKNNNRICNLVLTNNRLGNSGTQVFIDALMDHPTVRFINLSKNEINYEAVNGITSLLQRNTTICELKLSGNPLYNRGAKLLATALQKENCALEKLYLDGCFVGATGILAIANMLTINKSLAFLSLGGNNITDEKIIPIISALRQNRTLRDLHLHHNSIHNAGMVYFANELKYNISLQELAIQGNSFGHPGAFAIYKSMECNTTLRTLILDPSYEANYYWNGMRMETDEGVENEGWQYNEEMSNDIRTILLEYNDTLTQIIDPRLPDSLQESRRLTTADYANVFYIIPFVAPKKGHTKRADTYSWLLQHAEQWSALMMPMEHFTTTAIESTEQSLPQRQPKDHRKRKRCTNKSMISGSKKKY